MKNMKKWITALILSLSLIIPQPGWSFDPNSPSTSHQTWADLTATRNNLNDLRKHEIGPSEPGSPVAGMLWIDTTNHMVKLRNEANSDWISIWDLTNNKVILADGILSADTAGRAKMADGYITDAKVADVASGKITGTITPSDNTVSTAKLQASAVTGVKISTAVVTTSAHAIEAFSTWAPDAGLYFFTAPNVSQQIYLEGKNGGNWWKINGNSGYTTLGFAICDGTNVRVNNNTNSQQTIYYLKW